MNLSAQLFDVFDKCELRHVYERTYEPRFISPTGLLYACLEAAVVADDPEQGAKDAAVAIAQDKKIEIGQLSPLSTVRHVGMMAGLIGLALRDKIGEMRRIGPVQFGAWSHIWEPNVFASRDGLQRIVVSADGDQDHIRAIAHQWGTIGEMVALEKNITLQVVIIGARRGGRYHSPWTRGLTHPVSKGLRFRKKGEGNFKTSWQDVWRDQRADIPTSTWLRKMQEDEVLDDLILERKIQIQDDVRLRRARKDMSILVDSMRSATVDSPMRRSSCDLFGGCPFADSCWSPTGQKPGDLPDLYRLREAPEEHTPGRDTVSTRRPVPVFRTRPNPLAG